MKNSNRIVFIDYVRVIACFLVMLVHASENFYCISADTTMLANESNRFWVAFYDGALGRMSVPLFMVVSAFLLVPVKPNVSMSDFYKHRFKRIIPPLGNEFIAMLKDSSLVSVIGFEELTRRGQLIIARTYASFEIWMAVAIIYLIMTFAVARFTGYLERRFDTK